MRATMSSAAPPAAASSRTVAQIAGLVAACAVVAGCVTGSDDSRPSNQTTGTLLGAALGGTVGGLAFGTVGGVVGGTLVGALAGNLVGRALDEQERQRLAEATQQAYASDTDEPVVYTVPPPAQTTSSTSQAQPAQPTVVSAKPAGPKTSRPDGGTCRPIELTATKNGQTTRETTTFCQAAGSTELKPVSV
jgi:surface antigen